MPASPAAGRASPGPAGQLPAPALAADALPARTPGIDLWWIPLGAGGSFVRANGRVYEALKARAARRRPAPLYHSALEVHLPEGRYVVENAWPIPDGDLAARGVVVQGPVFSPRLARLRSLRYEVRCWRAGVIGDAAWAPHGPQRISDDAAAARRVLAAVPEVPAHVWGRKAPGTGEMWNSNSVIAWVLARGGLPVADLRPPGGGRAPGWGAGARLGSAG